MAQNKTQSTNGAKPAMWGSSIVGYGQTTYQGSSGRTVDWFAVGPLVALIIVLSASTRAAAQNIASGVGGKHACALLSTAEIQRAAGRTDVARSPGNAEEVPYTSNCQYWGAVDITIHLGDQTKAMFARERDTYAHAPERLGYKVEPVPSLGDDAYFLSYKGKAEVRVMAGETELVVSLSGSLPSEPDARQMALNLARAAVAKLR